MKKILVTAALPYANGNIHLGHIMSTNLPADIFARFHRLIGNEVVHVCATDEHGAPIMINAQKEGKEVKDFVNYYHDQDQRDFELVGISYDSFYHTDSPENEELAIEFYNKALENGFIEKKPVQQLYDKKEEKFLSDRFVKGECPFCAAQDQYGDGCEKCGKVYSPLELKNPYSTLSKEKPILKESTHLFFKLNKAKDFLKGFLERPGLTKEVVNYIKNWLEKLEDWDISREPPYAGFKIPGEEKYFYVWWDAPLGYFASLKHYCDENKQSFNSFVKNEKAEMHQFIGKDIVYHHYLFWPVMLHVNEYILPNSIPVRGHLTLNGEKFSKSRGISITPSEVVSKYDKDFLRFYLTAVTPNSPVDVDFTWKEFKNKVNGELIDNYGNLLFRVTSMIKTKCDAKVPEPTNYEPEDKIFAESFTPFLEKVKTHYEKADLKQALETIMDFCRKSNKYVNDSKPWDLHKNKIERYKTVLYLSFKAIAVATIALTPITPDSCDRLSKTMGFKVKWDETLIKPGLIVNPQIPFKKIEEEY